MCLLISLCLAFSACDSKVGKEKPLPKVRASKVVNEANKKKVTFPGKMKAAEDVNLAFRISGTILRVPAKQGTFVKKGTLLAEIDPRDYKIQVEATEAEYTQIKNEAERIIKLYEQNSVAQSDYEKAVYGLQQITAKFNSHKNALKDTKLIAPFDGYIQKVMFDANETVGAGTSIVSIINTQLPEVEINIPSTDYIKKDSFDTYSCVVDIFPDVVYPLELIGINQKANLNQLYTVRLKIKDADKTKLPTPGMSTTVTINYKEEKSTLKVIPLSAIFKSEKGSSVWVYNPSTKKVNEKQVKIEWININGQAAISEGLSDNDTIITAGVNSLSEDEQVELLPEMSETNVGGLL